MLEIENYLIANPSSLWADVNNMEKSSRIGATISYLDSQFEDQQQIVNTLANYFDSVFEAPRGLDYQDIS